MNQEEQQSEVEVTTDPSAAPGETPSADAPGPNRDVLRWAMESEHLLREIDPLAGWRQWKLTGYTLFKVSLGQPEGESNDIFLLCLTGDKLREALMSLRPLVRQTKLFDEFCLYCEESDPSKNRTVQEDSQGAEEKT